MCIINTQLVLILLSLKGQTGGFVMFSQNWETILLLFAKKRTQETEKYIFKVAF